MRPPHSLIRLLPPCAPPLPRLRFERCSFSEAFCKQLPELLARHPQLATLCFRGAPDTAAAPTPANGRAGRASSFGGSSAAAIGAATFGHRSSGHGPLWATPATEAFDEALAFLPTEIPTSVTCLHFEAGATSRAGVRVLGAALHSFPSLRGAPRAHENVEPKPPPALALATHLACVRVRCAGLSLAHGGLKGSDLTPLFSLLQGGPGTPPCALRRLSLRDNRLADVGCKALCEALCAGGRAGTCLLEQLDVAANRNATPWPRSPDCAADHSSACPVAHLASSAASSPPRAVRQS